VLLHRTAPDHLLLSCSSAVSALPLLLQQGNMMGGMGGMGMGGMGMGNMGMGMGNMVSGITQAGGQLYLQERATQYYTSSCWCLKRLHACHEDGVHCSQQQLSKVVAKLWCV
jgi:hypothetical protein